MLLAARDVKKRASLIILAVLGWAICGATVGVGRRMISMEATLVLHALVAPLAFALLTWLFFRLFPESSPLSVALTMLSVVVVLDALVVAPFMEKSYAMFGSVLGTWVPFASIFAASYLVGRASHR